VLQREKETWKTPDDFCIETFGLTVISALSDAVDHVALRVQRGSFYGFLGPIAPAKPQDQDVDRLLPRRRGPHGFSTTI
jgi:hypothetical protein